MEKALKVLKQIETQAQKHFIPCIGPVKGKIMEKIIKEHKIKTILEVGALVGYSSILMARFIPMDGKITTIEIDKNNFLATKKNLKQAGFEDKVKVIHEDALIALPKINETFDLLFLDAIKEDYLKYLLLAEKNIEKKSVVIADNVGIFKDSMQDYLNYVKTSKNYISRTVKVPLEFHTNVEDAMEISIRV